MTKTLNFDSIISPTCVDGPGRRAALFLQGCPIRCRGCQSPHLWHPDAGHKATAEQVANVLLATGLPVTVSGGEPFYQAGALAELVGRLKAAGRHVIVYTGYVLEDLLDVADAVPGVMETLEAADVLVDGPYVAERDHDGIQWRGSDNQRPIDLAASRATGWREIVTLDWDTPVVIVSERGDLLAAADVADLFLGLGSEAESRRCGQCRCPGRTGQGTVLCGQHRADNQHGGVICQKNGGN